MKEILHPVARVTSIVFHPLLIPTLGFYLLFNSGFYFAVLPWSVMKFMLVVVFLSTCLLPAASILLLSISPRFDIRMPKNTDRIPPMMISAVYYYIGYLILRQISVSPVFNFFLLASILVQIALIVVSLKWKISAHSAAIGGLVGGYFGLAYRLQQNPVPVLISLVLVAGMVGTARMIQGKHTQAQVYAGFSVGFLIMYLVIMFV